MVSDAHLSRWQAWPGLALLLALAAVALWMWLAFHTAGPVVLSDEYWYWLNGAALSDPGRLAALQANAVQPGDALFLRFIHVLTRLDFPVDVGVKALNISCLALGYGLLIWTFRGLGARMLPVLACAVFLPSGSYAAYVMPECLYFALFALVMVLTREQPSWGGPVLSWCAIGAAAALLTLSKSHGVLVFLAFGASAFLWSWREQPGRFGRNMAILAASALTYLVTLKLGQTILAPPLGGIVGTFYLDWAKGLTWKPAELEEAFSRLLIYGFAVGMLFAPCLVYLVLGLGRRLLRREAPAAGHELSGLLLLATVGLVSVVVAVMVRDEPERVHLRYVNFAFPWLLLLSFETWSGQAELNEPMHRRLAGAIWLASTLAFLSISHWFRPLPVDSPLLFAMYRSAEFGPFGLGGYAFIYVGLIVIAAASTLLLTKASWMSVQLVALACIIPLAIWNVAHWQRRASVDAAALGSLGVEARAACGAPEEIEALGTPTQFVPLYSALAHVGLGARFKVLDEAGVLAEMSSGGGSPCVLTPVVNAPRPYRLIDEKAGMALFRR